MSRAEFMRQLESLLQNISQTEREEALQYYNDYFDDAGAENEQDVLEALGNPARVAENIKRDMTVNGMGSGGRNHDYEHGYGDEDGQGNSVRNPVIEYDDDTVSSNAHSAAVSQSESVRTSQNDSEETKDNSTLTTVLMIVGAIFLAPVALGLSAALVSALFGLATGWFSMIIGFAAAFIALMVCLIVLLVLGAHLIVEAPLAGVAIMGGGLICGGLGILFLMLTVALAGIVTPLLFRGLKKLWAWIVDKITKSDMRKKGAPV